MSGLYNMIMGVNPATPYILGLIGVDCKEKLEALGRFRDCWLSPDATKVMILHRNYAANGDQELLDAVAKWPSFLSNRETYDSTYAIFEFSVPGDMADLAKKIAEVTDTSDRWEGYLKVINDLRDGKSTEYTEKALEAGKQIFGAIDKSIKSGAGGVVKVDEGAVEITPIPPDDNPPKGE